MVQQVSVLPDHFAVRGDLAEGPAMPDRPAREQIRGFRVVAVVAQVAVAQYHRVAAGALGQLPAVDNFAVQVDQQYIAIGRLRGEQRVATGAAGMIDADQAGLLAFEGGAVQF